MTNLIRSNLVKVIVALFGDKEGMVTAPILAGPSRGKQLRLKLTGMSEGAMILGRYEKAGLTNLAKIIQPNWTVWDCGTFVGYYTLLFAEKVGREGTVVAFEPDPANFRRTKGNIELNRMQNVRFVEAAVGAPIGEVSFVQLGSPQSHLSGTYVGASDPKSASDEKQSVIRVQCLSLDQAWLEEKLPFPNLIKLDLEGNEVQALSHVEAIVKHGRPIFAVELHNPECDDALWNFAKKHGYSVESLGTGQKISRREDMHLTEGSMALCRP